MNEDRKGLTPAGVAVVVVCCVSLLALPLLFVGARMMPPMGRAVVAAPTPHMSVNPTVTRTLRRVGKDIQMTVVLDNSKSRGQVDVARVEDKIAGISATSVPANLGPIAAGTRKSFLFVFKNVPKGLQDIDYNFIYQYPNGSASMGEGGTEQIP